MIGQSLRIELLGDGVKSDFDKAVEEPNLLTRRR
jgi:hypothetical protein